VFGRGKLKGETLVAQGVVLSTKWISENRQKAQFLLKVQIRVHFPDGSTGEFSSHYHHVASVGDVLEVRYDPNDRSKLELVDQSWKEQRAAREAGKLDRVAAAEQRLAQGNQPPTLPTD
jgi:hypothetical protein